MCVCVCVCASMCITVYFVFKEHYKGRRRYLRLSIYRQYKAKNINITYCN